MGNGSSRLREEYGDFFLQTDEPHYMAGECVSGVASINLHKAFPSNCIYLQIKGQGIIFLHFHIF